jgi:hypothetical protein
MTGFVVVSGAVLLAVSVKIACDAVGLGEKEAVTPLGRPAIARVTLPSNPFSGSTFKEQVVDVPIITTTPPQ